MKSVVTACKAQGVTCFTQVNSRSAVERIFANEPFEEEEPMPTTPAPRLAQPAPVRPSAPAPAQPPTLSAETAREVEQLRKLADDAKAGIDLLTEAAVSALTRADNSLKDAAKLEQLRALLK